MVPITPGDILSATFQFVRGHPKAIAIWSAVYVAMAIAGQLAMRPFYQMLLGGQPSAQPLLLFAVAYLLIMVVVLALNAAIFRAALDPDPRDSSYLRFGMDELRLLGLMLFLFILFFVATILASIAISILAVGLAAMGVLGIILNVILGIAAFIGIFVGMIYFTVRLASAGPLTILRKRITLREAWRLTRGHFWPLFGAYAVVAVIWLAAFVVISAISPSGDMQRALLEQMSHPGDPNYQRQLIAAQIDQMSNLGPAHIVTTVIGSGIFMVLIALQCGSIAIATKLLLHEENLSSVF